MNVPSPFCCYSDHVVTINDVAERAGVSPTTAKRAIRAPEKLAPATLERVQQAIDELHYEPDNLASALRSGQSKTLGLVVGSIVEPFFAQLTRTIGKEVRARGYTLLVADSEYEAVNELEQLKAFYGNRIAGLILRSGYGKSNLTYLQRMQERGTKIVEIDYFFPGSPFSHVMLDNEESIHTGVDYLAALEHRRIAALGTYHPTVLPDERTQAFPRAMQAAGLALPETYQHVIRSNPQEARALTLDLMALDEPPTALFATTGNLAVGAFRALRELGLRIPEDVSLLSFDDYPWTSLVDPPIDVIKQPVEEMGKAVVEVLFTALGGDTSVVRKRFQGTLIKRGSCAAPKVVGVAG